MQHEHYTHTAPDIPSSTALSIFFFLLMQLLFLLLVLFQDFLHNLLFSRPILHFRFDFLLEIPRTPCPDQRAIPQNIVHHLFSKGCSIFFPFSHTLVWNRIMSDSCAACQTCQDPAFRQVPCPDAHICRTCFSHPFPESSARPAGRPRQRQYPAPFAYSPAADISPAHRQAPPRSIAIPNCRRRFMSDTAFAAYQYAAHYYLTFIQKSQRSFPRPSVMLLSQISFGCSPV